MEHYSGWRPFRLQLLPEAYMLHMRLFHIVKCHDLQELTLKAATQSLDRSKELFNNAQITYLEFRQAQINKAQIQQKLLNAQIQLKLSEFELLRLRNKLL